MSEVDMNMRPVIRSGFRLQWEPAQNAYVMLYPEGMIKLNQSAGEILKRCQGEMTVAQIVTELERAFEATNLQQDVSNMIALATEKHWLEMRP
jgi:pyrroloquinoline quinone biosynthesis protein D